MLSALGAGAISSASGQELSSQRQGFTNQREVTPVPLMAMGLSRADASHWRTGLWTGVIIGALAANILVDRNASIGTRLGISLAGATPLAVIGTLLGSAIPKQ